MGRKKKGIHRVETDRDWVAQKARDRARAAFEAGDYRMVRELNAKVVEQAPDSDLAMEASREIENLTPDPWTVRVGYIALAVLCLAWLVGLRILDIS